MYEALRIQEMGIRVDGITCRYGGQRVWSMPSLDCDPHPREVGSEG